MVSYHPDSRFLTDFASANLSLAEAVCVSAHLEFCDKCRGHVQQLKEVGAHLLSHIEPVELEVDSFERTMSRLAHGAQPQAAAAPVDSDSSVDEACASMFLPRVVRRLSSGGLDKLRWAQFGHALRIAPLPIAGERKETSIYDIKAGCQMPEHEHRGEEITVLLQGSFSDADGSYSRGDFLVRNAGEAHQPTATQDDDCICLVCLERPVRAKAWFYRLAEPFVEFRLRNLRRRAAL